MGIGARLKEAREEKELSLDTLQDTTKIQKRYLVAIEEENFSILPGKFYAKAFIKEYAIAVGLDPNELMEEYKQDIPSPEEDSTTQYTRIHRSRKDNMPTKNTAIFSFIPTLIVILLIIGIVFLAWWFITQKIGDDENTPSEQTSDNTIIRNDSNNNSNDQSVVDDEEQAENDEQTDTENTNEDTTDNSTEETDEESTQDEAELGMEVVEEGSGTKPLSTIELSNVGEELIFEFESTEDVWLDVSNEADQSFFSGFVTSGEPTTLDLTGQSKVFLNVGRAPGLAITINGVEFEYPVDPNQRGADHQQLWFNVVDAESNE
ncbi:helix-turn-helix domain-containing protein [Ornithinibacillus contaminans]|uniref:helix-turn-helix domain-containing protein n=1 Tax=Ornithinibacillus contaminans TaxID=694055 RepID=UPI00064DC230|nr:RodZ domain-containing protein [Ornithinibacillus contaminans]